MMLYPLNDIVRNWRSFYAQEKNTVDILIVGNSHAYSSFNTEILSERTGKNAYILAGNSQNAVQTYFNVKEALAYQHPENIVMEASSLNSNSNWQNGGESDDRDWKKESNIDGMRFGPVKLAAVRAQYRPDNWAYALFPIARCHGNWAHLEHIGANYVFFRGGIRSFSPFRPSQSVMSEETMRQYAEAAPNLQEYQISEANIVYFKKLAALCRDEGIALYVVMAPMYDVYIHSINYKSWEEKISALTAEEGVTYLDCNLRYGEIGMTAEDFEDAFNGYHHTNAAGARKITEFVAEELYETDNA